MNVRLPFLTVSAALGEEIVAYLEIAEKIATIVAAIATVAALYRILNQLKANSQYNSRRALDIVISILNSDLYMSDRHVFIRAKREYLTLTRSTILADIHGPVHRVLNAHEIIALYINDSLADESV